MTPEQLKASILQYAIQGKLVKQRKEEGTAEELYQKIQEEKQKLIKEGKIKKQKELPEITKDEIPFDIPESWKWVRWGQLSFSIQYGYNTPAKRNGKIKMVRISDIQNGKIIWETVPFCDIKDEEIPIYLLAKNDILFARTGGTVGKSYIVKEIHEDSIYAGYLIRTKYSDMLCPEYLYYFMQTQLYWEQLRDGTIATAQPNCNGQRLSKMILTLPPLEEQKRIVTKIEELLTLVDDYAESYKELEQLNKKFPEDMKKSILQYAFQGKLVNQRKEEGTAAELYKQIQEEKQKQIKEGKIKEQIKLPEITKDEIQFDIPESWKLVRLGEIVSLITDGTHKTPNYIQEGIPFLSVQNISSGQFTFSKIKYISKTEHEILSKRVKPQKNDILFCRIGTLGKAIKIDFDMEFSIFVSLGLIRLVDMNINDFLLNYLNSPTIIKWIDSVKVGGGTHTFKLNLRDIPNMLVPLPPLEEQKRIVTKIEKLLTLCENLNFK